MYKKIINKNNIILTLFVTAILIGVVMIVVSSRQGTEITIPETEVVVPTGAQPGGPVLTQQECVELGGRVADTTKNERCFANEEIVSAVTGFYSPALCCVSDYEKKLNQEEAFVIAQETAICTDAGAVADFEVYNPNSNTWWFSILSPRSDCRPACVVSDETNVAEINWRCAGALVPEETEPVVIEGDVVGTCEGFGGEWLDSFNECENISQSSCDVLGGEFNECGSACRNNPEAEMCTMQCVPYCTL